MPRLFISPEYLEGRNFSATMPQGKTLKNSLRIFGAQKSQIFDDFELKRTLGRRDSRFLLFLRLSPIV